MRRSLRPLLLATAIASLSIGTARAEVSEADREFIDQLAMAGQAEVANGEIAAKSENSAIADFGKQMVQEHGEMNQELMALAKQKGVEPPTSASVSWWSVSCWLTYCLSNVAPGMTLITAPLAWSVRLALVEKQASSGDDPDLKALATKAIPVVQKHITELEALKQQPGMQ